MPTITDSAHPTFEAGCAPRRVMELFAVKWVSMVLHALDRWPGGRCRTGQLQRALPGVSKKMLVQTLRDMETRGLISRHIYPVVPPKVEYELTALGKIFAGAVEMLYRWGTEHAAALDELQANAARTQKTDAAPDETAEE